MAISKRLGRLKSLLYHGILSQTRVKSHIPPLQQLAVFLNTLRAKGERCALYCLSCNCEELQTALRSLIYCVHMLSLK